MRQSWLHSLRFRVLAGSVVALLILFGLVNLNTSRVLKAFALENTRTLIAQTSETLNLALVPQTTAEGLKTLDAYLNRLVRGDENGIVYLAVLDEGGRILAGSRSTPGPLPDFRTDLEQQLDSGIVHVDQAILLTENRVGHLRYGLSARLLRETNARLVWENLILFTGGLIVTIIILVVIGRRVGSQLGRLVQASQALAAGDYEIRAPIGGDNEFSYLAHNFNLMADAVAERERVEHELETYREHLVELVAERTAELEAAKEGAESISRHLKFSERAMAETKQKAEAGSKAKSEFLANMSHEIRTPLNGVLGMASIGLRDSREPDTRERFNHILDSGQHLLGILNDILDLSKMDAGKLHVETRPFKLAAIVEDVLGLVAEQAHAKNLALSTRLDPDLPAWVAGDALRLRQVLLNLLSNAVKFTERGKVQLHVAHGEGHTCFTVSDTGIGMSGEQISRLSMPFDQADSSTTRRFGGTGLGLSISYNLAHLMGGDITVASEPGKGSTFTLCLPLSETASGAAHAPHCRRKAGSCLTGIRVLVAEDVELNRIILEDMLEYEGAQVVYAENGRQALDLLQEQGVTAFDILLMDIQMPVMDGHAATRRIREIAPKLPVIGLTAHALAEERERCLTAGMVEHITKPIDADLLVAAMLRHLKRSQPPTQSKRPSLPPQEASANIEARVETPPDSLPGIDLADGLKRLRGKWPTYKSVLLLFYRQHSASAERMASLLEQGAFEEARLLAHSLKGSGGNLGAKRLHEEAAAMETACRAGDSEEAAVRLASLRTTLEEIMNGLAMLDEREAQPGEGTESKAFDLEAELNALGKALDEDLGAARRHLEALHGAACKGKQRILLDELETAFNDFDVAAAKVITQRLQTS